MFRYGRLLPTCDIIIETDTERRKMKIFSNPFEVAERKTLAVENIVDKNKHLTILFFIQHYTHLDTCPKYHPYAELSKLRTGR